MAQFCIPAVNLPRLEAEIAELNKRAKRLKVEAITFEIQGWETREVWEQRIEKTVEKRYALVEIAGRTPKLGGWSFAAKLEPTEAGNLIKSMPGFEATLPEQYRTSATTCDHCGTKRLRNEVFVVSHEDGRWAQVGRNCLADFLGHTDPEALARMAEFDAAFAALGDEAEDEGWGGGYGGGGYTLVEDTDTFVATVAAFIRFEGWAPRSSYGPGLPTADSAWRYLFAGKDDHEWKRQIEQKGFTVTEADQELARRSIAWAKDVEPTNDYLHNIKTVATLAQVTPKETGIIASVVNAYRRAVEKAEIAYRRREAAKELRHLGTVSKREVFADMKVANVHNIDSFYGVFHIVKLVDPEGNVMVWKTSSYPAWFDKDDLVTIKATVVEHGSYREEPQTEVKRVVLV